MSEMYNNPKYYEIAFSFRNIAPEVDTFEEWIRRYSQVPVETFLELGSGNSPHMPELVRRKYRYIGVDRSEAMLAYARTRVPDAQKVSLLKADMCHFRLERPAQFAFVALGSLFAPSTAGLLNHFGSVAGAIKHGGLYLLDWCVQFSPFGCGEASWEESWWVPVQ